MASPSRSTYDVDPGRGWIMFASVMFALIGVLNVIYGIAAIDNATFYARDIQFVFGDLKTWGWVLTILGIAQLIVAYGVWTATEWGRWLGIVLAGANMIVEFIAIGSHPVLSILVFFIDVIILWGLLTYGGRDRYSLAG